MKTCAIKRFFNAATLGQRMASHFVFVYGTLKKGEPNHDLLTNEINGYSKFVAEAETMKKFPLIIASKYNIPFLLDSPGTGENVLGEVYEVDDKMLQVLDELEDHPTFYTRNKIDVLLIGNDGKTSECESKSMECWSYLIKNFKPELLLEEHIKDYRSCGPHGKPYSTRERRDPNYHAKSDILMS